MGRRSIGIDLSEDYIKMAKYRLERTQPALFPVTEEVIKEGNHDEQSVQKYLGYQEAHIEKNDTLNHSSFKNDPLPKTDDTLNPEAEEKAGGWRQ